MTYCRCDAAGSDFVLQDYHQIRTCTEEYFEREGDTPLGMGWPNVPDAERRFDVMLEGIPRSGCPIKLLDFGCGTGHLYEHLVTRKQTDIEYYGIDLSSKFIETASHKHPDVSFIQGDVLTQPDILGFYDFAVINGVFTSKCEMSFEAMLAFVKRILSLLFRHVRNGLAFNAMSKQVDWERDDLFHLPLDTIAQFLCQSLSRDFVIRNDYGLYEYTTYVYRHDPDTQATGSESGNH